jgi:hypothetical protein
MNRALAAFLVLLPGLASSCGGPAGGSGLPPDASVDSSANSAGCRSTTDCIASFGSACKGSYDVWSCGPCLSDGPASCTADSDCAAGKVCQDTGIARCGRGPLVCAAACMNDSQCLPTYICTVGHCQLRSCAQCLPQFGCTDTGCVLLSCQSDAECPGGYCVNATCQPSLGACTPVCL